MTPVRRRSERRGPPDGDQPTNLFAQGHRGLGPGIAATPGFRHSHGFSRFAWSPDGNLMAAGDPNLTVWRATARDAPIVRGGAVTRLAWHPSLPTLATLYSDRIERWDAETGVHTIIGILEVVAKSLAWSPDGSRLAVTDFTGCIGIWDPFGERSLTYQPKYPDRLLSSVWSADGDTLAVAGQTAVFTLSGMDLHLTGRRELFSGSRLSSDVALSPDGHLISVGQADGSVRVAEVRSGRQIAILEGHGAAVTCVAFSATGDLVASASKTEVMLWRRTDWDCVATLVGKGFSGVNWLAFHPHQSLLATTVADGAGIACWSLDSGILARKPVQREARQYVNAKVVLLGDTGVGKSGLGLVLSGQPYAPTDSTHARNVWIFDPAATDQDDEGADTREVLLWDLAGQPGYRLVHQLHLHEVAVALVVFDARSESDPFAGVKHWVRALLQARRLEGDAAVPGRTFLIAARVDRGGVPVSTHRLRGFMSELGLDEYYETSAKEGLRIAELKQAILAAIDWDLLPTVSSNALLEEIRAFVLAAKGAERVLATVDDLYRDYARTRAVDPGGADPRAQFEGCLARIESRGLVRRLHFGNFVLLQPELLDSYASALVLAAKDEPDGLGVIAESDALTGHFRLTATERIESREEEKLLLIATVEELLRHEVALKEITDRGVDLVFPSEFTRERPGAPHMVGRELVFRCHGALHNIYATLAVRLARSMLFTRAEMWRNASTYTASAGGVAGISFREIEEGVGEFDVFFEEATSAAVRSQFGSYVFEHLQQHAAPGTVSRRKVLVCPGCRYALPDDLVEHRLARGDRRMRCPDCEKYTIPLQQKEEGFGRPDAGIAEMHISANARREDDVAATRLKGKVETSDFDVFLCHDHRDKAEVVLIAKRLRARGIHPWLDEWEIPPGARWQTSLQAQLTSVRSAAVFVGARRPGPWQDIETEALLQRFAGSKRRLIPVILESRTGTPRLPMFLKLWQLVDMRKPSPDPFEQLVWGITDEKPTL